jgi:alcohol dehydrogenase YqhD (iron-dependent ADH family)
MTNFDFYNPTKIIFGENRVQEIGKEALPFGKKCLMVYGKSSIKKNGVYDTVMKSLAEAGISAIEHPGVKSNPILSHTQDGVDLAKKEKVDFILAVGGGSVVDESKAIAAGATMDESIWEFLLGNVEVKDALPVLDVLTIPATGTEMNPTFVLTNDQTNEKVGRGSEPLSPKVSILDPSVTVTIPPDYTAYSAVDVISHLIEGYFTGDDDWTPIQDGYVENLVKTIIECTARILKNPENYQARATFMWAATLAWNGLGPSGIGNWGVPMHLIEHPLSGIYDIAHGAGLSITIPAWLTWKAEKNGSKIAQFGRNVFGIEDADQDSAAKKTIEALKDWFDSIDSPTSFKKADIPESDTEKITDLTCKLASAWGMDKEYTRDVILDLYSRCL